MPNDSIPEGFELDTPSSNVVPEGFELDQPNKSWWQQGIDSPMGSTIANYGHQLMKGVPLVGNLVKDSPENQQFYNQHKFGSNVARTAGFVGSMAPLSAAAAIPEAGFGVNALRQMGLFGGEGAANLAAKKASEGGIDAVTNTPASEYIKEGGKDALLAALGEGVGKVISPNMVAKPSEFEMPQAKTFDFSSDMPPTRAEMVQHVLGQSSNVTNKKIADAINSGKQAEYNSTVNSLGKNMSDDDKKMISELAGAGLGYTFGGMDAGILGAIIGPSIKKASEKYVIPGLTKAYNNQIMTPTNKAVLDAMTVGNPLNSPRMR